MIVNKHDGRKNRRSFLHRRIAISRGQLIEKFEDLGVFEIFPEKASCAFVQETEEPRIGDGVPAHARESSVAVRLVGGRVCRRIDHDMPVHGQHIAVEKVNIFFLRGEYLGQFIGKPVHIRPESNLFPLEMDAVQKVMPDHIDRLF